MRAFIKEMLESQIFPERHYTPGGKMIRPYDITSWSLPLHKGVNVFEINENKNIFEGAYSLIEIPFSLFEATDKNYSSVLVSVNNNDSYKAVFNALKSGLKVKQITEEYIINNITYPIGSFIINKGNNGIMNQLNNPYSPL